MNIEEIMIICVWLAVAIEQRSDQMTSREQKMAEAALGLLESILLPGWGMGIEQLSQELSDAIIAYQLD